MLYSPVDNIPKEPLKVGPLRVNQLHVLLAKLLIVNYSFRCFRIFLLGRAASIRLIATKFAIVILHTRFYYKIVESIVE